MWKYIELCAPVWKHVMRSHCKSKIDQEKFVCNISSIKTLVAVQLVATYAIETIALAKNRREEDYTYYFFSKDCYCSRINCNLRTRIVAAT